MNPKNPLTHLAVALGLAAFSCVGPTDPAPAPLVAPDLVAPDKTQSPTLASREAARKVDLLTKLLVIDRKAVELSEMRLAHVKDLAKAGRLGEGDVLSAELELLKLRQQLLVREQELADAQLGAAANDRLQAGHRD